MSTKEIIQEIFALPENQQWQVVMNVLHQLQEQRTEKELASSGDLMSMEAFQERLAKAEQDIAEGRVFTSQEVRDRVKTWHAERF
jgi:hypothetical protein